MDLTIEELKLLLGWYAVAAQESQTSDVDDDLFEKIQAFVKSKENH